MNTVGLFIIGAFVSLLVAASVALLSWGAVLDGRYEQERQSAETDARNRTEDMSATAQALDSAPVPQPH